MTLRRQRRMVRSPPCGARSPRGPSAASVRPPWRSNVRGLPSNERSEAGAMDARPSRTTAGGVTDRRVSGPPSADHSTRTRITQKSAPVPCASRAAWLGNAVPCPRAIPAAGRPARPSLLTFQPSQRMRTLIEPELVSCRAALPLRRRLFPRKPRAARVARRGALCLQYSELAASACRRFRVSRL
jgi:hypothetical protein